MIAHRMYDYYVSVYIYYLCCVSTCKASFGSLNSTVRDCPVSACHVLSAPHLWNALWDPLPPCLCSPASMEYQTSAEIFEMPENPVQQNVCDIATLDFPFSKWFSHFLSFIYIYTFKKKKTSHHGRVLSFACAPPQAPSKNLYVDSLTRPPKSSTNVIGTVPCACLAHVSSLVPFASVLAPVAILGRKAGRRTASERCHGSNASDLSKDEHHEHCRNQVILSKIFAAFDEMQRLQYSKHLKTARGQQIAPSTKSVFNWCNLHRSFLYRHMPIWPITWKSAAQITIPKGIPPACVLQCHSAIPLGWICSTPIKTPHRV